MSKDKILTGMLIVIASVIYLGCGNAPGNKLTNDSVDVEVQQAVSLDGSQTFAYSGTIEESESLPISFSTVGSVSRVLVSEGDYIRKGQLLAVLNDETFRNIYDMTLASQKQAEDGYKRLLPMYKNGNLPEIKLVEVETGLQQAKASALIAKKNVDDCKLYSPVDGVVGKRAIDPGMTAMPNLTSITIIKIDKVFAKVSISESDISNIKKGDIAKIKIGALNYSEFTGKVEEIGVMSDPIAHTYKIKIGIGNKDRQIKPGMICNVSLEKINNSAGLFVPDRAVLIDEQGRNFVYTVNQNKAGKKYVQTGKLMSKGVEITGGLNNGEEVVVAGQQKLVDNSNVRIIKRQTRENQ